ncbi:MAG: hypothetical protein ACPGU1_22390 [Myxococcota bacterium]
MVVEGEAGNETYCVGSPEHLGAGPGLTTTQLTPIEVHLGVDQALPALESISCSPNHACGLDAEGQAYCWGSNDSGQLGSGTTGGTTWASKVGTSIFDQQVPEPLVRLSLRQDLSCGWTAEGAQYCWGDLNALSVAKAPALAEPTAYATLVEGEPYLVQAGNCRLHAEGHVSCRGKNSAGELGQGEKGSFEDAYATPVLLEGLIASDLAMEPGQLCAIDADEHPGQVRCVGTSQGHYGGMGAYDTGGHLPQVMAGALPIITEEGPIEAVEIDAGSDLACAILTSDELACWTESGDTTVTGNVSVSASNDHKYAHHVEHHQTGARLTTVSDLSVGEEMGCAVVGEAREVLCWGDDPMIVKGTGEKGAHPVPTEDLAMPTLQDAVAVSISKVSWHWQNDPNQHACAVIGSADAPSGPQGEVWCWGSNLDNQMGRGEASALQEYPAPVLSAPSVPLSGMKDVQVAYGATCALPAAPDAPMVCWGSDAEGLMGNGAQGDHPYATPIAGIVGITDLSGGQNHFCAIGQSVTTCWGSSEQTGATGQGSLNGTTPSLAPVAGIVDPLSVHSGAHASCVIEASGQTKCWGTNDGDRFGQGIYFSNTFLPVLGPNGLVMGCTPEVESCDGIDNDCDGLTDEDLPSDGEAIDGPCSGD